MDILETIKKAGSSIRPSGNPFYDKLLGKAVGAVGRAIDIGGKLLGNPIKDVGASEVLEQKGAELLSSALPPDQRTEWRVKERTEQGKPISEADVGTAQKLNIKNYTTTKEGITPKSEAQRKIDESGGNVIKDLTSDELRSMGLSSDLWHGQEIEWGGKRYRVEDTGRGTRNLVPITQDTGGGGGGFDINKTISEASSFARSTGTEKDLSDDLLRKVIEDVRDRGMSTAQAMENRLREAYEQRWRELSDIFGKQKQEIASEAQRQRQMAREQEAFYKGEIEKRKRSELENIASQKEGQEKEYEQVKDDLGRSFADSVRQLNARLRAIGVSASSFAAGEQARVLRDFNQNLAKVAIKHKDILNELDKAHRETEDFYNGKINELEMQTRKQIGDIDAWERGQISAIQNNERLSLADKLENIARAINMADQIRLQVEQNYQNQIIAYTQWQKEMKLKMALAAQEAAKNRIDSAKAQLSEMRQAYAQALQAVSKGIYNWQAGDGNTYTLIAPSYLGNIPLFKGTEEEKQKFEQKQQQLNPYSLILQSMGTNQE